MHMLTEQLTTQEQDTESKHEQLQWLLLHQHQLEENLATHLANALQMQWRESSQTTEKMRTDLQQLQQQLQKANVCNGPVVREFEKVLEEHGIYRQAYFSGTFVGNHIHKALQSTTITALAAAPFRVINARSASLSVNATTTLKTAATALQERYKLLFTQYASARKLFASCSKLDETNISQLEEHIRQFMSTVRAEVTERQKKTVTPKLHLLEQHLVPLVKRFGIALGLLGEQGGEGIHHHFNELEVRANISKVKTSVAQLKIVVEHHLHETIPTVRELVPKPAPRKRKHCAG